MFIPLKRMEVFNTPCHARHGAIHLVPPSLSAHHVRGTKKRLLTDWSRSPHSPVVNLLLLCGGGGGVLEGGGRRRGTPRVARALLDRSAFPLANSLASQDCISMKDMPPPSLHNRQFGPSRHKGHPHQNISFAPRPPPSSFFASATQRRRHRHMRSMPSIMIHDHKSTPVPRLSRSPRR